MNKLLEQQLRKYVGDSATTDEKYMALLNVISESYDCYETDRQLIERSIERSSKELTALNAELQKEKEALKNTHEELKALFENVREVFFSVDMISCEVTQMSAACEKVYGYPASAFISDSHLWKKLIHPDDKIIAEKQVELLTQGKEVQNQYRILNKDKTIRWLENKVTPTLDHTGRLIRIDGITSDISERKKAEEEIIKSNLRYQYVTRATSEAIWDWDIVTDNVFFGEGFTYLFGDIIGGDWLSDIKKVHNRIHPEDIEDVLANARLALKGKEMNWHYEHRYLKSDGNYAHVSNKALIIRDDEGRVIRVIGAMQDISDSKKNEAQISDSEKRYRTLFEQTLAGFYQSTAEGEIIDCNEAFAKMLKYGSRHEILKVNTKEFYFTLEERSAFVNNLQGQKKLINHEGVLKCKDGSPLFYLENTSEKVNAVTGKAFFDGVMIDISDRKLAEQLITISEEKRNLIMNAALDAIICIDTRGDISFWNPQAEAIFGWKEDEVMGKCLSGIIIPDIYRERHDEGINNYLKTGEGPALNTLLELSAIRRNGELFPIELTVLPIRQGGEEFFCAFIRDITNRKKSENAILVSNERYNLVAKATNDVIWDWDLTTNEVIRNKESMKKILGYDVDGTTGNAAFWTSLIHPEDVARVTESFKIIFNNPLEMYMDKEYRIKKENGEYAYIYDKGFVVRDATGKAIRMIGACQDITKLKENELQLQKHAKELALSNEELEQFAYVASHDLQEPLRMVTSFLTLLEKKYGSLLDDKGKRYIDFAVDGAKRMRQIILDLLEYSRAGRTIESAVSIDVNELVQEIQILFRKRIEEKMATIVCDDLPMLHGYISPLRQVFQNLISNALKYSRNGVLPKIKITVTEQDNHWEFAVTDNGMGIAAEYFDKIFIIFQRLHSKDAFSGTGLGLAITKKIIESQGGKIWLSSEEGKGSTFYFTLSKSTVI
ncbi:MAG: PAS domain S-box protein [Rhizobacter sp.]|nr:PAS domain S-box protein [Ferruginibacter sp.]